MSEEKNRTRSEIWLLLPMGTQENAKYSAAGAVSDFLVKVHMVRCTALGFTERLFEIFDQKFGKSDDGITKY